MLQNDLFLTRNKCLSLVRKWKEPEPLMKRIQIGKEEIKLHLFAGDMTCI